jgi:hypothetical protein
VFFSETGWFQYKILILENQDLVEEKKEWDWKLSAIREEWERKKNENPKEIPLEAFPFGSEILSFEGLEDTPGSLRQNAKVQIKDLAEKKNLGKQILFFAMGYIPLFIVIRVYLLDGFKKRNNKNV